MPALLKLTMLFLMGMLGVTRTDALLTEAPSGDGAAPDEAPAGSDGVTAYQEQIVLAGGAHGYDRHEIHGRLCAEGYSRGFTAAMMSGSGLCMVEGWASDDPEDCRVRVRLRQGPHQSGVCLVTVYEIPM